MLLSHDELTMVKQEEVIHSSKVRGLCIPPRQVGGLSPAPATAAYSVDCELSLVCSKIVEMNFKNNEHSVPYRWVTNTAGVRDTEKTSGNQSPRGAESRNSPLAALFGVDIISPLGLRTKK